MASFTLKTLQALIPLPQNIDPSLRQAAAHALETEGSMSRALLAQNLSLALGQEESMAERLGASIELFHLASLILDDLPCMDDASTRRMKACVHTLFGESSSILAAPGFINRAYRLLWLEVDIESLPWSVRIRDRKSLFRCTDCILKN